MASPTEASYISRAKTWIDTSRPVVRFNKTWTDMKNYDYKNSFSNLSKRVNDAAPFLAIAATAVALYNQPTSNFGVVAGATFIATLILPEATNRVVNKVKNLWNKAGYLELAGIVACAALISLPVTLPKIGAVVLGALAAKSINDRSTKEVS